MFVGLQNYLDNFQLRQFQFALRNNFVWVAALALGKISLAALVAMILARQPVRLAPAANGVLRSGRDPVRWRSR